MPSLMASCAMAVSAIAPFWVVVNIIRTLVRVADGKCALLQAANLTARHVRAPLRPAHDRAEMAGGLGVREDVAGLERRGRRRGEVLRARDAPVSVGRAAHGAPEELLRRRCGRALPPPHRQARPAPDGLRRIRTA